MSIQTLESPKNSNFRVFQDKVKESLRKLDFRIFRFTVVSIHWSSNGCAVLHFHLHVHEMCKFIVERNIVILSLLNIATIT